MPPRKKAAAPRKKTPQDLMDSVNAKLGTKAVMKGSDPSLHVRYHSTGLLPFDILFQGGMPTGRMSEIYGDYSTLKSVVGLSTAAQVQRNGGTAAIIDTEHAFEPMWAERCGVDTDQLIVWPPREDDEEHFGEEAFDVAQTLVADGIDYLVFDSIAATLPQAEGSKRLAGENIQPARLAALMSAGLRRLTTSNSHTAMTFINQTRLNVGITFGNPEVTPGGKAMPFYASYRCSIRKTGKITRDMKIHDGTKWTNAKQQIGQQFKAELLKSKLSKPFMDVWFAWDLETGQIDLPGFIISQSIEMGKVRQSGNTWSGYGVKKVGMKAFKAAFANDQNAMVEAEQAIRAHHGLPGIVVQPTFVPPRNIQRKPKKLLRAPR